MRDSAAAQRERDGDLLGAEADRRKAGGDRSASAIDRDWSARDRDHAAGDRADLADVARNSERQREAADRHIDRDARRIAGIDRAGAADERARQAADDDRDHEDAS